MLPDPDPDKEILKWVRVNHKKAAAIERDGGKVQKIRGRLLAQKKFPARLSVATVARWLDCSPANVRDIESAKIVRGLKRQLTPEQADVLAHQTGVHRGWLLANDPAKAPVAWHGRAYSQKDFEQRQKQIASGRTSFATPQSIGDIARPRRWLAEYCAFITAILLRGLRHGQADVVDYRLRAAFHRLYGEALPGEDRFELQDLIVKAAFHGNPSLTRPDLGPLLDEWDQRYKSIIRQRGDKLPLEFLPRPKAAPAIRSEARPRRKQAKQR